MTPTHGRRGPSGARAGGPHLPRPPRGRARPRREHAHVVPARPAPLPRVPRPERASPSLDGVTEATVAAFLVRAARGRRRPPAAELDLGGADGGGGARLPQVRARRRAGHGRPGRGGEAAGPGQAAAQGAAAGRRRGDPGGRRRRPAPRWRCATGRCSRCSTAPAPASPRRSGSTSTTSTPSTRPCCCAARAARSGSCRSAPTRCEAVDAYLVRGRPELVATGKGTPALFLNARGGRLSRQSAWAVLVRAAERAGVTARRLAAHAAALVRHPPARRRRRRTRRPGAARPRVGHDHAGLHAGHRRQPARGVRQRAPGPRVTADRLPVTASRREAS